MTWLILPALLMGSVNPEPEPFKCRSSGQYAGSPIRYYVDGELLPVDTDFVVQKMDTKNLLALRVGCLNPRDGTFSDTGMQVIVIWTTQGPVSRMEPTLAAIVAAQDAHHREKAEYAGSVSALSLAGHPAQFRIDLETRADGWNATIRMNGYDRMCFVYDGAPPSSGPSVRPREPTCGLYGPVWSRPGH